MRRWLTLGLLLVAVGGWLLGWSPYLRVATISVEGVQRLSRTDVVKASGIEIGQPLARVSGARVERGLSSIPRIKSYRIIRSWPDGITLQIKERVPLAQVGNKVMDDSGALFTLAPGETAPALRITTSTKSDLKSWLTIYKQLPDRQKITEADISDMENMWFMLSGTQVIWGSSDESATKIDVLKKLGVEKWRSVDLSAPLAPTTTKK